MKKIKLIDLNKLMLLLLTAVLISSCGVNDTDDDEDEPLVPNQEGFYVFGTNTIAEDALDPNARMNRAVLDHGQGAQVENMEGVYGGFMYIGANSTIQFSEVEGENSTQYGASGGGSIDHGEDVGNVPINDEVIHGMLEADASPIQVEEEGLYYVFVNTLDDTFVIMNVKANIIGDATEKQWAEGTSIPTESVSVDGAVFEVTDLMLNGESGYRYRFNDGFHVYQSTDVVTMSSLGVEDYATAWDTQVNDIGFYLDNIPHHESGVFTIRLEYDAETAEWSETKTKTGELLVDHSETEMGLFGNAFEVDGTEAEWDMGYELHAPSVSGNSYTWTWENVELIEERAFIFLEDGEWGGLLIDYNRAAVEGEAIENGQIVNATSVEEDDPNFYVVEGGTYNITLLIDEEGTTVTID
ncbi:MAG: hypothetical protein WD059_09980 [Balneolaceae bacterium]